MTRHNDKQLLQKLSQVIEESLALLKQAVINEPRVMMLSENIPVTSLLDQCVMLCEQYNTEKKEPIRLVQHFGLPESSSLLPSLATLPNVRLLTNINLCITTFNKIEKNKLQSFRSQIDMNAAIDNKNDDLNREINSIVKHLQLLHKQYNKIGCRLLIFNNNCPSKINNQNQMPDALTMLRKKYSVRELVIVAKPVDEYQAYCSLSQKSQQYLSFDEYCQYRLNYIQTHPDAVILSHEDFVSSPITVMKKICAALDLSLNEDFMTLRRVFGCP